MSFQPQRASGDGWVDINLIPPSRFVAAAMDFPVTPRPLCCRLQLNDERGRDTTEAGQATAVFERPQGIMIREQIVLFSGMNSSPSRSAQRVALRENATTRFGLLIRCRGDTLGSGHYPSHVHQSMHLAVIFTNGASVSLLRQ